MGSEALGVINKSSTAMWRFFQILFWRTNYCYMIVFCVCVCVCDIIHSFWLARGKRSSGDLRVKLQLYLAQDFIVILILNFVLMNVAW